MISSTELIPAFSIVTTAGSGLEVSSVNDKSLWSFGFISLDTINNGDDSGSKISTDPIDAIPCDEFIEKYL